MILGTVCMGFGVVISCIGVIVFLRNKHFYAKLLSMSLIEVCGVISVVLGMMLRGVSVEETLKLLLIIGTLLIVGPISAHEISRQSLRSRLEEKKEGCS